MAKGVSGGVRHCSHAVNARVVRTRVEHARKKKNDNKPIALSPIGDAGPCAPSRSDP
jgi:hypothetical protein